MTEQKYQTITSLAIRRVRDGLSPEQAWLETLKEVYPPNKLSSQLKHTCPKWAFCTLCHKGFIKGIRANCCVASERSTSGVYVLKALTQLIADNSISANKRELKRRVFGEKNTLEYRTPNDEVEVLLALWGADEIQI